MKTLKRSLIIVINEIKKWVEEFVSVHNENLGTVPCPFAKQAMLNDTIRYIGTERIGEELRKLVEDWNDKYEVVCIYTDPLLYTVSEVRDIVNRFNEIAMKHDIVALEDHPHDAEMVNGVKMNFGIAILILVQRLSKLNKASAMLKKQGYYDNWPEENYADVVEWRFTENK